MSFKLLHNIAQILGIPCLAWFFFVCGSRFKKYHFSGWVFLLTCKRVFIFVSLISSMSWVGADWKANGLLPRSSIGFRVLESISQLFCIHWALWRSPCLSYIAFAMWGSSGYLSLVSPDCTNLPFTLFNLLYIHCHRPIALTLERNCRSVFVVISKFPCFLLLMQKSRLCLNPMLVAYPLCYYDLYQSDW